MIDETNIQRELAYMFCGDLVGRGQFRNVHSCKVDDSLVVKLENGYASFYNTHEWMIWNEVKDTPMAKWFAPCEYISANGSVLVMKKTRPADKFPTRIPAFFDDLKRENWGLFEGRLVCHDYGHNNLIRYGITAGLKKAEWL